MTCNKHLSLLYFCLGQWKQWNSDVGVVSNCMCFVIAHCSAQVKGLAFTGYSATPKTGIVTKMNGPRHIISIDNQPAGKGHLISELNFLVFKSP